MKRSAWALVFALACVVVMLAEWVRDHAKDQVLPKDPDDPPPS